MVDNDGVEVVQNIYVFVKYLTHFMLDLPLTFFYFYTVIYLDFYKMMLFILNIIFVNLSSFLIYQSK